MSEITIKELARICGVAVSTVSRAMNDRSDVNPETRARIVAAAQAHGYVPNSMARRLKIGSSDTIAVFIQGEFGQMLMETFERLEIELGKRGFDTTIAHISEQQHDHASIVERVVRGGRFAGVVFLGRYGSADREASAQLSRRLAEIDVPMVFCTTSDYSGVEVQRSWVSVDDASGARDLTAHLIARGHRRIGFIGAGRERDHEHAWALRLSGYGAALRDAEIESDDSLIVGSAIESQVYTMRNGYESLRRWLRRDPDSAWGVTAFVAACDAVAIGAARALDEAGLSVPGDVSLVGFDGLDVAEYSRPRLTTLEQPIEAIAETTARLLVETIRSPHRHVEQVWIRGRLIERESVRTIDDAVQATLSASAGSSGEIARSKSGDAANITSA